MRELSSKFEGGETVDVGTLSRRVRRENPDITSLETKRRSRQILSYFRRYLELRVPRRPRSFAKRVKTDTISKVSHHMSLCGCACSFKNLPLSHPTGAVRRVTTAKSLELLSSLLIVETIARQSSHHLQALVLLVDERFRGRKPRRSRSRSFRQKARHSSRGHKEAVRATSERLRAQPTDRPLKAGRVGGLHEVLGARAAERRLGTRDGALPAGDRDRDRARGPGPGRPTAGRRGPEAAGRARGLELGRDLRVERTPVAFAIPLQRSKAAQPRSSEKNAASRAGRTPCARWAVGVFLTKARKSASASNRAFEEK